ncbi:hypothetical protein FP742_24745 [Vibrio parahaemolyticus]|uniref:Uncharacterized protein n=1 Tax=Vibrio parahaemolyticus serotype O3:K6 (strain RIMD 2210633) TaxID=223926 RepID=Q87SM5_VIBPA|nr:hypothetical protein A6J30_25085 [Vibrio parahaemolyticus]BAC58660.1 hypothetical protein [Vibrio parahaemolyticus RIMD 2210633]HAS6243510.1 hypothetical protein [Vibrio vulnificus]AZV72074.1 hypothetical protein D0853_14385 [Vibrio parahaemolyticus]EGQ8460984.1 hypothetical protein [Vibrio parahaemolyticus]
MAHCFAKIGSEIVKDGRRNATAGSESANGGTKI